ncbi:glycosyltransferase family 2 protein, partial [Liquorilactobacillus satsumensis]|uniref:glycosyltransferase family 2 protein n=1 Tax=Liquorilactobacillus satsumensis TaxID=259059 RepID=UPI0039EABDB2
ELIPCDIDELKKSLLSKVDLIWFNESNSGSYDLLQSKNKLTVLTKMSITGNGSIKDGIHGKFYRRAFIKQNQLLFNPTLRIGEDVIFNFECLCRAANLNLSTMLIYQRNASSSVHLFDKYNVTNELNFRKSILQITDLFKSSPEAQNIKTRFGINGLIFLIECYFAPLVRNGSLSLREASAKLQKIMLDGHYTGFDTNKFDNALSKRGKIFRRLINKKRFGMAIILLNTEDKIKGIKRI